MTKTAEVMVELGVKITAEADEWIVSPSGGYLTLRINGEPVAEFNRWYCVKWAEQKQPLVDMIGERIGAAV